MASVLTIIHITETLTPGQVSMMERSANENDTIGPVTITGCSCAENCGRGIFHFIVDAESLGHAAMEAERLLSAWGLPATGKAPDSLQVILLPDDEAQQMIREIKRRNSLVLISQAP